MLPIHVIAMGPGNRELLTAAAARALSTCTVVAGDRRLLEAVPDSVRREPLTRPSALRALAASLDHEHDVLGIVVSGDVGFYSLAKAIRDFPDCTVQRHCGISSLVYFAAQLGMSWEDVYVVSRHGRKQALAPAVLQHGKVFCLTGGIDRAEVLCRELCAAGLGGLQVYVGEYLSYDRERIRAGTASELAALHFDSLAVMMILNEAPAVAGKGVHGLDDRLFLRGDVPMTKQEVRSVAISKLAPRVGDTIYDVGAGTGSCSVELALQAPLGKVYALEVKAAALQLLEANKARFGVENMHIVSGEASEHIAALPPCDCAFIGGTKGRLAAILDRVYEKNERCRVVITAVTLETVSEAIAYYKDKDGYRFDIVNLFVAAGRQAAAYTMMIGQNPVYVMRAVKQGGES